MKEIFLKDLVSGKWISFKYNDISELSSEFTARGIDIDSKSEISSLAYIGNNTQMDDTIIGNNVTLGDNVTIAKNCVIGRDCYLADGVTLEQDVLFEDFVTIGEGAIIRQGLTLGVYAKVNGGIDLADKYLVKTSATSITYVGEARFSVGCITRTLDEWRSNAEADALANNYTDKQLNDSLRVLNHARDFYNNI